MKHSVWYQSLAESRWERRALVTLFALILLLPLQRRMQFASHDTFITGGFTEYTSYFLYATDLLLVLFTVLFAMSRRNTGSLRALLAQRSVRVVLGFLTLTVLLLPFSQQLPHSLYYIVRLFLLVVFCIGVGYFARTVRTQTTMLSLLVISGVLQSLLAILQVLLQRSLGLFFLTGESRLSPSIDNVAKVLVDGDRYIRAYGTLPHPNILAAFLVLALLAAITLLPRIIEKNRQLLLLVAATCILTWGLVTTLSRASFLYGAIAVIVLSTYVLHVKLRRWNSFHVKRLAFATALIIMFAASLLIANRNFLTARLTTGNTNGDVSKSMREELGKTANDLIVLHPLVGTGLNTIIFDETAKRPALASWRYQPVHNIYHLLLVEGGTVTLVGFLIVILASLVSRLRQLKNAPTSFGAFSVVALLFLLAIGFYDHFLITLQQGQLMLWFALGLTLPTFHKKR